MDYTILAKEFLHSTHILHRCQAQKGIQKVVKGEVSILRYLAVHAEEALPGEIGKEMKISSARVAQTLNSLEKKGWIARQIDPEDRRRILVSLTARGREEAQIHQEIALERIVRVLELLGEEDAKEYVRITSKLAALIYDRRK